LRFCFFGFTHRSFAMPHRSVETALAAPGPKKILACDGGGIRGVISVEILAQLEASLRQERGDPALVLSDWFDFVCGTSTGAIMAACIASGMSMAQIREFYIGSGKQMFEKASLLERLKLRHKFDDEPLAQLLRQALNQALGHAPGAPAATLGDPGLRTLLMMVLRNHSTDSPWPLSNNPRAKFNQPDLPDCNLKLPLWQLVRASTAAPTYFPPETVRFGQGSAHPYEFVFVDGGITTYNNPAFLAFQMATAAPYRVNWPTGEAQLLIVSVGTGSSAKVRKNQDAAADNLLDAAQLIPGALMDAASAGWDMACRLLGQCRFGPVLDGEIGDMVSQGPPTSTVPKQFSYVRYTPELSAQGLAALGLADIDPADVQALDAVGSIPDLQRIGQAYARQSVRAAHLHGFI
jgi:predicted acylesterase/phospholipase RssA